MQGDRIVEAIKRILSNAKTPIETTEVVKLVLEQIPTTRTIIFKRLHNLRGDQEIKGKQIGCGKGTWLWWTENFFEKTPKVPKAKHEKIVEKILEIINSTPKPLETKEIEELCEAIPSTRTIIFKRLTDLRGDGAIRGKHVGSGKGTWVWWRNNE